MAPITVDPLATHAFQSLATIPVFTSATLHASETLVIQATQSTRDLTRTLKKKTLVHYIGDTGTCIRPVDASDSTAGTGVSPSGRYQCVTRMTTEKDGKKKRSVEVYDKDTLVLIQDVTEKHGEFYHDDWFGGIAWSEDETRIAYVADKPVPTDDFTKTYWRQDLGEGFIKKGEPTVVVLNVLEKTVQVLDLGRTSGQPCFGKQGELYYYGVSTHPLKYGIRYCHNRIAGIYRYDIESGTNELITDAKMSCRSPRITPDLKQVYYIANPVGGPHDSCASLHRYDTSSKETSLVVDRVQSPKSKEDFPGLYMAALPTSCWVHHGGALWIVCTSLWRSRRTILAINANSGKVIDLAPYSKDISSYAVLAVNDKYIVAHRSNYVKISELIVAKVDFSGPVVWTSIASPSLSKDALCHLDNIQVELVSDPDPFVETILLKPKRVIPKGLAGANRPPPMVVFPHGGPHSAATTDFLLYPALLASIGFVVALVNFTGSVGFGDASVHKLVGQIGNHDVEDVHRIAKQLVANGVADPNRVTVCGGSHGGFIAAHLLGRYPDFYKAGALRNPVINVGTMIANTDIPDWTYGEAGLPNDLSRPEVVTPDTFKAMFAQSPDSVAHKVKSPVLLMLGENDRRVPPTQGLRWGQYLKGRGVDVNIFMYPDVGHALDTVEAEYRGFEALASFFIHTLS